MPDLLQTVQIVNNVCHVQMNVFYGYPKRFVLFCNNFNIEANIRSTVVGQAFLVGDADTFFNMTRHGIDEALRDSGGPSVSVLVIPRHLA